MDATRAESPFVGCFSNRLGCFVYDANTNEILKVEESIFLRITDSVNSPELAPEALNHPDIIILQNNGYLSSSRPSHVTAPCEDCLSQKLATSVSQITLEVTRACNHRCLYCPFSSADKDKRFHSKESMDWKTASTSIDYLFSHSKDEEFPALGFYGGEPLLEWDLIEKCLNYATEKAGSRNLHFSLTTNGTLLTKPIAKKLAQHNVGVMVSLDGSEADHNAFRIMSSDRSAGHSATLAGLANLREAYGFSAKASIRLLAVTGPWSNFERLEDFFAINPPAEVSGLDFRFSEVSHPDIGGFYSPPCDEGSSRTSMYECDWDGLGSRWFNSLVDGTAGTIDNRFLQRLFQKDFLKLHKRPRNSLGDSLGPMGMCDPGVRKAFVQVNGDILLCERVHDKYVLGNIHQDGVQVEQCTSLLERVVHAFDKRCTDCVFCRLCSGCPSSYCDSDGSITDDSIERHCEVQKCLWADRLPLYAAALDQNPNCFNFMDDILVG